MSNFYIKFSYSYTHSFFCFFNNLDIDSKGINKTTKKRMCIGIAKFYIKVAHLFAAIITTVQPQYVYKEGNIEKKVSYKDSNGVPPNAKLKLEASSLCGRRIQALGKPFEIDDTTTQEISINPKFCDINKGINNLSQEPGIPELELLYLDDYDYNTGKFKGMTESTQNYMMKTLKNSTNY